MTGVGPGSSAIGWAGRRVAAWIGRPTQPEPYLEHVIEQATPDITDTIRAQMPHTAPDWLTQAADVRAASTNWAATTGTWSAAETGVLGELARLSERMSPYQAATTLFGGQ